MLHRTSRARRAAMGLLLCNADPAQTEKKWLQILHSTTRRSSTLAWLVLEGADSGDVRPNRSGVATFTQPLQNEDSLSPLA
jgi:hypothetical protein